MKDIFDVVNYIKQNYNLYSNCFIVNRDLFIILNSLGYEHIEIDLKKEKVENITHYSSIFKKDNKSIFLIFNSSFKKDNKSYIVDLTYFEFFTDYYTFDGGDEMPNFKNFYTNEELNILNEIITTGLIEYTPYNMELYLKGFKMASKSRSFK